MPVSSHRIQINPHNMYSQTYLWWPRKHGTYTNSDTDLDTDTRYSIYEKNEDTGKTRTWNKL